MAIDTSIIGRLMPVQFKTADPMESVQKSLALQGLMGQQDLQGMQLDEARRGAEANQRLQALFSSNPNATPEDVMRIDPAKGLKMRQDLLTGRKTESEIAENESKVAAAKAKLGRDLVAQATPQNYQGILAEGKKLGMRWAMDAPPEYDPMWQRTNVRNADDYLRDMTPKIEFKSDNKTNRAFDMNPFTNPNIGQTSFQMLTTPGEDLTDARQRELAAAARAQAAATRDVASATREANATTYDADRGVLVNRATGEARPAMLGGQPVGPKERLTDTQKKELASIDSQQNILRGALAEVDKSPDAFGTMRGLATMAGAIPESMAGKRDTPAQREARSYVYNVVSKVINERAGAAQSAQELARLRSFLPAETDNAQQIKDKLNSFGTYLENSRAGYDKPQGVRMPQPAQAPQPAPRQMVPGATRPGPVAQPGGVKFLGFE